MPEDIRELINAINEHILNPLIALLFAVALLVFIWGMAQYIFQADSEEGRITGRRKMIWGVIGMFIMFSVWGIMWIIVNTFPIDPSPIQDAQAP
jgi:hypothetical protein